MSEQSVVFRRVEKEMAETVNIYFGATSLLTALGDKTATLDAMSEGTGGLRYSGRFGMNAGIIDGIDAADGATRFETLAVSQLERVLAESGIRFSDSDTQLVLSTTKGDVGLLEGAASSNAIPERAYLYNTAMRIAGRFRCANRPVVISNACISGVSAFVVARDMLINRSLRHAVILGCDVLSEFITSGFASFKSISPNPCRPYDAGRDGLTLGEACGAVVLTTDVNYATRPLVRLTGGAVTNDANHISGPSRTGDGLCYAIEASMRQANVTPSQIGFINTHGTATLYNDEMESKAVALAGLSGTPLNGVKGYIGHTLGASGVVETIICIEELRRGQIFGTLGYEKQGTSVNVSVSSGEQKIDRACCVKTASGFGGCNASIVLEAGEPEQMEQAEPSGEPAAKCTKRNVSVAGEYSLPQSERPFGEFIRAEYKRLGEPNMKFFKMSDLCKAVYIAAENLLRNFDLTIYEPARRAIILANSVSSLETDAEHQHIIDRHLPEGASPAVFVYTLPNVAAGEVCIRHKFQGDNTFFIEDADSGLSEEYARHVIADDKADMAICGWCDKLGENWNVNLKLLRIQ